MTSSSTTHRVLRSTRSLAVLATLAMVATLLTGVTLSPASAGAGYQKPKVGQCRNITYSQSRATTNSTKPISCASRHTAQTISVGKLSKSIWKSKAKSKAAVESKCEKAWNKAVGRTASLRLRSAFALSTFVPTKAQKKKGATWFRCDAVVLRGKSLTPLTTTKKPLLGSPTPANQARCIASSPSNPTTCDAPHNYKATAAFKLKGKKYPGKKDVTNDAKKGCNSRVSTSSYKYDAPSKADWNDGMKYVVCFSQHTLPPPPPPVDPSKPTTTMVVPTSVVSYGTNVTVTGTATDDEKVVNPLAATIRNAGGLYVQDNGSISASVNTYPVSVTSGAYGTPSVGWSMLFDDDLPVGTYTVAMTVTDDDGQTAVVSKSFSVADTEDPNITINNPAGTLTTAQDLVIAGAATDNLSVTAVTAQLIQDSTGFYLTDTPGTTFTATVNNLPLVVTNLGTKTANYTFNTDSKAAGDYTVRVTATDSSGRTFTKLKSVTVGGTTGTTGAAIYEMNEAAQATTMVNSGDQGQNGAIDPDADLHGLTSGTTFNGATGYTWSDRGSPTALPVESQRVITAPENNFLDPGPATGTFSVEVRYRTSKSYGNLIQKGQNTTVGGYWKIELPSGKPSCLFKVSATEQTGVSTPTAINNNQWHVLRCIRNANYVTMFVDGIQVATKQHTATTPGTINNNNILSIGGKPNCTQDDPNIPVDDRITCDYFTGQIDYVEISHS